MTARFPLHPAGVELGVSVDFPWDESAGGASDETALVLEKSSALATHLSLRWRPRTRAEAEARDHFPACDDLLAGVAARFETRALHHAAESRWVAEAYRRGELLEMTNALVERYGFAWVTEDVSLWPIQGKPEAARPNPNQEALWAGARHARVVRAGLDAPLVLDGPSFADGDDPARAFEFFGALAEEADVAVSMDASGFFAVDDIEKLPLGRCFEIRVTNDAEIEALERVARHCPNLRAIVYQASSALPLQTERTLSLLARLRDAIESRRLFDRFEVVEARI